ncbi:MAG: hypothetical protein EBV06_04495 [Planctomycetia bacterium]|nr:hypothetical protein [Planctomycetia bacterium]
MPDITLKATDPAILKFDEPFELNGTTLKVKGTREPGLLNHIVRLYNLRPADGESIYIETPAIVIIPEEPVQGDPERWFANFTITLTPTKPYVAYTEGTYNNIDYDAVTIYRVP